MPMKHYVELQRFTKRIIVIVNGVEDVRTGDGKAEY
jgi:hypothetical protein